MTVQGRPYKLIAGEGVILKYGEWVAFAEQAGRAVLNGQTPAEIGLLTSCGDIDLTIGDSNFNGLEETKGEMATAMVSQPTVA